MFGAFSMVRAYVDARRGERAGREAAALVREADLTGSRTSLEEARANFRSAEKALSSPLLIPIQAVPGMARQVGTAHALAQAGVLSADAGLKGLEALEAKPPQGWVQNGRIDLNALRRAAAPLRSAAALAQRSARVIEGASGSFLVPPLMRARERAADTITSAAESVRRAAGALTDAPALLGAGGPRRYLLLFANLAELRGSGGLYGFDATLSVDDGALSVGDPGRPKENHELIRRAAGVAPDWYRRSWEEFGALKLWSNVNASPDFPTVARIAAKAKGMDGVVQIDGKGIAALLRLTGPISLDSWPEPVTADNVVAIAHNEVYVRYTDEPGRDIFGNELLVRVFDRLLSKDLQVSAETLGVLSQATTGGHIQMFVNDPSEQRTVVDLGLSGGVARTRGATDVLGVYNLNADESKQDFFLHRTIAYDVRLDPGTNSAQTDIDVKLRDAMPAGSPEYVAGPGKRNAAPADNKQNVLLTHPKNARVTSITVDRPTVALKRGEEAHLGSERVEVVVPAQRETGLHARLVVPGAMTGEGRSRTYRLFVLHQPVLNNDRFKIRIIAPPGWEAHPRLFEKSLTEDVVLTVELRQSMFSWLGHQLLRPVRALQRLF